MRRLPVVLHAVYKNDWSSAFSPGCACVHLPTMTPSVKPPRTLVSVLHWLWYCCRATALSALANLTLLLVKNTLPFPAFGNLNFVSPTHRRAYTSIPKSCPNIRFPHQQDFFPIRSVTKSSTARFSHENLVEKFKIFVQDFVPIRTALIVYFLENQNRRCSPDRRLSECYTPEARAQRHHVNRLHRHIIHTTQQFTTAARRQTAPPHHTHNFCWHGPRQRSHGEGTRYFYQLVLRTGATSGVELWRRRYNPKGDGCYLSTDGLRMCNMYQ